MDPGEGHIMFVVHEAGLSVCSESLVLGLPISSEDAVYIGVGPVRSLHHLSSLKASQSENPKSLSEE